MALPSTTSIPEDADTLPDATITPVLLRDHEVAAILNISKSGAWKRMASGEIPGVVRIGRSIRVHRATLERWIEAQVA